MILFQVKKCLNKKMEGAYGKFYAYPVVNQTIGTDGLATHMSSHNTPFSPGAIKGMLTDMVICIRELALQGIAVKIDNLAIFSIGIKNKTGANSEEEFSVAKNIEGVKLRSRATGDLMSVNLNLDASLKKASVVTSGNSGSTDKPSSGSGSSPSGGSSGTGSNPGSDSGTENPGGSGGGVVSE